MLTLPRRRLIFVLKFLLLFTIIFVVIYSNILVEPTENIHRRYPPQSVAPYICPRAANKTFKVRQYSAYSVNASQLTDAKVLIFVETLYSKLGKQIIQIIDALKIHRKVETVSRNLPLLTTAKRGRYSLIIFENYYKYLNLPLWNRQLLDKYCYEYNVGIISFVASRSNDYKRVQVKNSKLTFTQKQRAKNLRFTSDSKILYLAKVGAVLEYPVPDNDDWVLFDIKGFSSFLSADDVNGIERAAVIFDDGKMDKIKRILFGHNFTYWINKIAFVDSLRYLSKGLIDISLNRYIQIDIDDIFVGSSGTRITRVDADALLASQNAFRRKIENFTYCLGFSGFYFRNGDPLEDEGDERLIELGKNFIWFPHMWRHNHANEYNETYLKAVMAQNKFFAQGMGLSTASHYAVSPQHAGVYPVHEALYNAWRAIWNISVTSTEEYPHFRPASNRRGFIHMNISVLPRQTCGLYTHTQFFHSYPGGFSKLISNIEGGDLFFTILLNEFSIFMTHQQNYANDRLAIFTFERVVDFIYCWTNLRLLWMEPLQMAQAYFQKFPSEKMPVWSNPCNDPRQSRILPSSYNCAEMPLPNLFLVGPQKTGSTALATYLAIHPNFTTNDPISYSYEELQFFGGANYGRGISWYMDNFRSKISKSHLMVFEKSATYFDNVDAPRTIASLIPKAAIVIILMDPADRAYSWYQHMRAHNDSLALTYSLNDILFANTSSPVAMRKFRSRCISPGRYVHHLEHWLEYFPPSQIYLVDGDGLRKNPASALKDLVASLHQPEFSFEEFLYFDEKKGFFCLSINGTRKCLGSSKGRKYDAMGTRLRTQLNGIFREDNIALHRFLIRNDLMVPNWLSRQLSHF